MQPLVKAYLEELENRLKRAGIDATLRIMLSSGGTTTASVAADIPIAAVESGPAGGVLSAANAGRASGFPDVLAFDMGGTTAKVCTVTDGEPSVVHMFETARVRRFKKGSGLPLLVASIDLIEIGSGGGSIARASNLGLLTVGPESASSYPGPACYGLGGSEPTVTDADLILGYLNPDYFLGGKMSLDLEAARRALGVLGRKLGLSAETTAKGIFNVVNEAMAGAARVHIAEKAQDPRQFTLVATGGAGPVHAVEIARKLRVPRVLFPIAAGTGSCLGFLAAPMRVERSWSRPARLDTLDWDEIGSAVAATRRSAGEEIAIGLPACETVDWRLLIEMRYLGQGATVVIDFPYREPGADFATDVTTAFHEKYREAYGGVLPAGVPEAVTWRVVGSTRQGVRDFVWPFRGDPNITVRPKAHRAIFCPGKDVTREVPVYEALCPAAGHRVERAARPGRRGIDNRRAFGGACRAAGKSQRSRNFGGMTMTQIDPVSLEILWTRLVSLVDEAAATLVRTSFSSIVRESNDYAVVLLDRDCQLLAQSSQSIPSFICTLPETVRHFLQVFPREKPAAGRRDDHERSLAGNRSPARHQCRHADLPGRRTRRLFRHGGPCGGYWGAAEIAQHRRDFRRRAADTALQTHLGRIGEPDPGGHHPRQCTACPTR